MLRAVIAATLMISVGVLGTMTKDPKFSGKTIDQVFSDPQVAKLATAACRGDTDRVAALIADSVDVNGKGQQGIVPLFYALKCEQPAALEALLKAGADPNLQAFDDMSATFAAISYADPVYLKLMLKYGGNPNSTRANGDTALLEAFTMGQYTNKWDNFELLLDSGVDLNRPMSGRTIGVAEYAAAVGYPSKAVELLKRGYTYDLEGLARAIYGNSLNRVSAVDPEPLWNEPEYKYLAIASKMLKDRGVDTVETKRFIDAHNKRVGAGLHNDYGFEKLDVDSIK